MFRNIKKYLLLVPCFILGLFLFTNVSVSATEAELINDNIEVIRDETTSEKNTYYYAPDESNWHFKVKDYDLSLVRWRVIKPGGNATAWSDYLDISKVSNYAKFDINFDSIGDYSEKVDLTDRESLAMSNTWWVDIEYYETSHLFGKCVNNFFNKCKMKDSESIKILKGKDAPSISVTYDESTMKAIIEAKMMNASNVGTGIITYLGYFLSETKLSSDDARAKFDSKTEVKTIAEYGNNDEYSNYFKKTATSVNSSEYSYLYVYAESLNGQTTLLEKNIASPEEDEKTEEKDNKEELGDKEDGDKGGETSNGGLFDGEYGFGELILIVLVIVLIVSCALIITQKIVDYKKRLY